MTTETELQTAAQTDNANIQLGADITLTNTLNITGVTLTINLNGHTLDRGLTASAGDNGHVIKVSNAEVTLNATGGGTITGGYANKGGGMYFDSESKLIANGVTFTNNQATDHAGAIYNVGNLTLTNCTVSNNTAHDVGGLYNTREGSTTSEIGWVHITSCRFTGNIGTGGCGAIGNATDAYHMSIASSVIEGNTGGTNGGGIWSGGSIFLENDSIVNNTAAEKGGGFWNESWCSVRSTVFLNNTAYDAGGFYNTDATAEIMGCTFSGNTGTNGCGAIGNAIDATLLSITNTVIDGNIGGTIGGGIWSGNQLKLNSVTIQHNTAVQNGSGIYYYNGPLIMQGNILVKDNTDDDIFIDNGQKITFNGALTGDANSIGVKMPTPGVFTEGYAASNTETNHFFPSGTVDGIEVVYGEGQLFYGYYECSWDSENKTLVHTLTHVPVGVAVDNICADKYASGGVMWGDQYWFIARGTGSTANGLTCGDNDVHLILLDDGQITINEGFYLNEGTTLHIYCQSYGDRMGKLITENTLTSQPG